MRKNLLALVCASVVLAGCGGSGLSGGTYNVKDFGVKGDGTTDDTVAIQKALDAASASKGTVVFPQGTFMTGAPCSSGRIRLCRWTKA